MGDKIEKVLPLAGLRCVAKVRIASWQTHTRMHREANADRRGLDPAVCNRKAAFKVDGAAMCLNHAGQQAIKIVMGEA